MARLLSSLFRWKITRFTGKLNRALRFRRCRGSAKLIHWFAARDARFFQAAAHAFLLASIAPALPARLRFLQQTQLVHRADGTFGTPGPSMGSGERKAGRHE